MKFAMYRIIACGALLITLLGCSDAPGKSLSVSGKITLDGKPLDDATVGFVALTEGIPPKYRYKAATTEADGSYKIEDIYPAEYTVTLTQGPDADEGIAAPNAIAGNTKLTEFGPNSPLRAAVSADKTLFNYDVVSK